MMTGSPVAWTRRKISSARALNAALETGLDRLPDTEVAFMTIVSIHGHAVRAKVLLSRRAREVDPHQAVRQYTWWSCGRAKPDAPRWSAPAAGRCEAHAWAAAGRTSLDGPSGRRR